MKVIKKPILMIVGIIICLIMIRLGIWQLDRAEQKQTILAQSQQRASAPVIPLISIIDDLERADSPELIKNSERSPNQYRFIQISAQGRFLSNKTILIDNQVHESKVGYFVVTPFQVDGSDKILLVNRGWVSMGESRSSLPTIETPTTNLTVNGRLNKPTEQPPLWNDDYSVSDGSVWQFLPIEQFRQQTQLNVLPLVLELAPEVNDGLHGQPSKYIRQWQTIDDESVNTHKAYALQWFSMAVAFLIACVVLLLRTKADNRMTQ